MILQLWSPLQGCKSFKRDCGLISRCLVITYAQNVHLFSVTLAPLSYTPAIGHLAEHQNH